MSTVLTALAAAIVIAGPGFIAVAILIDHDPHAARPARLAPRLASVRAAISSWLPPEMGADTPATYCPLPADFLPLHYLQARDF
jgi:hypothetical protein